MRLFHRVDGFNSRREKDIANDCEKLLSLAILFCLIFPCAPAIALGR